MRIGKYSDYFVEFSYDAVQKRIYSLFVKITRGVPAEPVITYFLFKQKVMYYFHPKIRTCVKYPLRVPFQPIAVPKNATFISQMLIGSSASSDEGLLVNIWGLKSNVSYDSLTFTAHGCFPVSKLSDHKEAGWSIETFMNMTLGIRNPNIFQPPAECFKQELNSWEEPHQASVPIQHFSSSLWQSD